MILKRKKHKKPAQPEEALLTLDERYDYNTLLGDLPEKLGLEQLTPLLHPEDPELGESSESEDSESDLFEHREPVALRGGRSESFSVANPKDQAPMLEEIRSDVLSNVRELRIGGGGARGYALPGFLRALVEYGGLDLSQVRVFNGISVGSSLSAFLSLGMSVEELSEVTFRLDGTKIKGMTRRSIMGLLSNVIDSLAHRLQNNQKMLFRFFGWVLGGIASFIRWIGRLRASLFHSSWGVCESDGMRATLEHVFEKKVGLKNPTFKDLQEKGIDLRVITTIVCCKGRREWTVHDDPDQEVIPVIIASMSIPGAFQPFRDAEGHIHSDGGVPNNVPPSDKDISPEHSLLLMFSNEQEMDINSGEPVHEPVGDFLDYGWGVINTMRSAPYNHREGERVGQCVVKTVDVKDFEAPYEDRLKAYREGFESGIKFLNELAYTKRINYTGEVKKQALRVLREERNKVKSTLEQSSPQYKRGTRVRNRTRRLTLVYDRYKDLKKAANRLASECSTDVIKSLNAHATRDGKVTLEVDLKRSVKL